jgi:prevent-host-death family protein
MKISEVKSTLSSLVNDVCRKKTRILVEKAGIPVAAIVSVDDLEWILRLEREWDERFAVIDEMREAFRDIPPDEIEREVAALVRQTRIEDEAARGATQNAAAERRSA